MRGNMNPRHRTLHDIFTEVSKAKTKADKIKILKAHDLLHVRDVLRGAFDDSIEWVLPEGLPPFEDYEVAVKNETNGNLHKVTKQLTYFVKGSPAARNVKALKLEKMWVNILESIHPDDADVLTAMKDKNLNTLYKGLTRNLVMEAFPNLIRK